MGARMSIAWVLFEAMRVFLAGGSGVMGVQVIPLLTAEVGRFVAQSVAWRIPGRGGAAVEELERMVIDARGVVIRYGQFYGPGTYYDSPPPTGPVIHIDEAARRTLDALSTKSSILTVVEH